MEVETNSVDVARINLAWEIVKASGLPKSATGTYEDARQLLLDAYLATWNAILENERSRGMAPQSAGGSTS